MIAQLRREPKEHHQKEQNGYSFKLNEQIQFLVNQKQLFLYYIINQTIYAELFSYSTAYTLHKVPNLHYDVESIVKVLVKDLTL